MLLTEVEDPKLVLIVGAIGFGLNIISILFLHGKIFRRTAERFDLLTIGCRSWSWPRSRAWT